MNSMDSNLLPIITPRRPSAILAVVAAAALSAVTTLALGLWTAPEDASPLRSAVSPTQAETVDSAGSPLASLLPAAADDRFTAVVAESIAAGGYTYLRVTDERGEERWVATMGRGQPIGTRVHVQSFGSKRDFHSRRTGRTFEHLVFGSVGPAA